MSQFSLVTFFFFEKTRENTLHIFWINETVVKKKKRTTVENLCKECHIEFHMYLNYVRSLRFDEKPDYDYLRNLFNKLYYNLGYEYDEYPEYDWKFDWTTKVM